MALDSLGIETEDKTVAGKLISQAGDFATSILGLSKTQQNQQLLDQSQQQLDFNRQLLELEKQKQAARSRNIWIIAGIMIVIIGILIYIFFINKRFKVI